MKGVIKKWPNHVDSRFTSIDKYCLLVRQIGEVARRAGRHAGGDVRQRTAAMSQASGGLLLVRACVVKTICGIRKGVSKPCTPPSKPCAPRAPCPP